MIKFYLNSWELAVEVGASITETLDEVLDSGVVITLYTKDKDLYEPLSRLDIETEVRTYHFLINSDVVELSGRNPDIYAHTLTIVQDTRKWSRYVLRNSSFTQPKQDNVTGAFSFGYYYDFSVDSFSYYIPSSDSRQAFSRPYQLPSGVKISNGKLVFEIVSLGSKNVSGAIGQEQIKYIRDEEVGIINFNFVFDNNIRVPRTINTNETVEFDFSNDEQIKFLLNENRIMTIELDNVQAQLVFKENYGEADYRSIWYAINVKSYIDTYRYTLFDVLNAIIEQQKQETDSWANETIVTLPNQGETFEKLSSTIAPNFNFTYKTLYEMISEILLVVDGIPVIEEDGTLGIEYFNQNEIKGTIESTFANFSLQVAEEKYVSNAITDYQNAISKVVEQCPSVDRYIPPRFNDYGIKDVSNVVFKADKKIYDLQALRVVLPTSVGSLVNIDSNNNYSNEVRLDLSLYVVEKSIYDTLDVEYITLGTNLSMVQQNTIYFNQASTDININATYRDALLQTIYVYQNVLEVSARWKLAINVNTLNPQCNIQTELESLIQTISTVNNPSSTIDLFKQYYNITYIPYLTSRINVPNIFKRVQGDMIVGQSNSGIQLENFGNNLLGTLARTGEQELSAVMEMSSFENRIKKGQVYIDENGIFWYASVVNTTIMAKGVLTKVNFSKNFNKISNIISIYNTQRYFEIDTNYTSNSPEVIIDYIYFSTESLRRIQQEPYMDRLNVYKSTVLTLGGFQINKPLPINVATFTNEYLENKEIYTPLVKYGAGNVLVFEMGFNQPLLAYSLQDNDNVKAFTYTENGFSDYVSFALYDSSQVSVSEFYNDYPYINQSGKMTKLLNIPNLKYLKRENEVCRVVYEIAYVSAKENEYIFGRDFIENNYLLNNTERPMYLYINNQKQNTFYSPFSTKVISGGLKYNANVTFSGDDNKLFIDLTSVPQDTNVYSLAIGDENGNLYLGINRTFVKTNSTLEILVYFTKSII